MAESVSRSGLRQPPLFYLRAAVLLTALFLARGVSGGDSISLTPFGTSVASSQPLNILPPNELAGDTSLYTYVLGMQLSDDETELFFIQNKHVFWGPGLDRFENPQNDSYALWVVDLATSPNQAKPIAGPFQRAVGGPDPEQISTRILRLAVSRETVYLADIDNHRIIHVNASNSSVSDLQTPARILKEMWSLAFADSTKQSLLAVEFSPPPADGSVVETGSTVLRIDLQLPEGGAGGGSTPPATVGQPTVLAGPQFKTRGVVSPTNLTTLQRVLISEQGVCASGAAVFLADDRDPRIWRLDTKTGALDYVAGAEQGVAGASADATDPTKVIFLRPASFALASDGCNLFVTETEGQRLRLITLDKPCGKAVSVQTFASFAGPQNRAFADGLALTKDDSTLFVGAYNKAIYKIPLQVDKLPACGGGTRSSSSSPPASPPPTPTVSRSTSNSTSPPPPSSSDPKQPSESVATPPASEDALHGTPPEEVHPSLSSPPSKGGGLSAPPSLPSSPSSTSPVGGGSESSSAQSNGGGSFASSSPPSSRSSTSAGGGGSSSSGSNGGSSSSQSNGGGSTSSPEKQQDPVGNNADTTSTSSPAPAKKDKPVYKRPLVIGVAAAAVLAIVLLFCCCRCLCKKRRDRAFFSTGV
ncbi:hypothetical protein CBR_g51798 [Chara braunii]|uniref:SMP-30/Gluconolactonase/LRE-like region domain-containing protein n=1 Tax=Chara braunii TaxID=69332 RepID=A0A388M904_CHABU|nr:hypothetical protein CBR_g51798 [Chara braunii]|eukprot:GBG91064.1 hypothetical protein CBR_g51798 [Chara braunii]